MWGDRLKLKPEGARRRLDREGPRSKCAISALLFLLSSFSFLPSSPFPFPFKPPSLLSRPFTRPKIVSSFFPHFVPIHFPLSIPEPRDRQYAVQTFRHSSQVRFFLPCITQGWFRFLDRFEGFEMFCSKTLVDSLKPFISLHCCCAYLLK